MRDSIRPALVLLLVFTVLLGGLYPLVVTAAAQVAFAAAANGSLVTVDGRVVGSRLIGQAFDRPDLFWGRPSATGDRPYDGASSSGANRGPGDSVLVEAVQTRLAALQAAGPVTGPVPVDLVAASASGLDPDISVAGALYQVPRVAAERGLDPGRVRQLVLDHVAERTFGVLGERRVNVLALNLALDGLR